MYECNKSKLAQLLHMILYALHIVFQSILLDHFYWQPLSCLCTVKHEEIREHVRKLSHAHCEMIRATPSFMRYFSLAYSELSIMLSILYTRGTCVLIINTLIIIIIKLHSFLFQCVVTLRRLNSAEELMY